MSNNWSDNLRKRMETHQVPSPEGLWEDIEGAMKNNDPVKIPPKQNQFLLWSKRIGSAAAAVLVLLLILTNFLEDDPVKIIARKTPDSNEPEQISFSCLNKERKDTSISVTKGKSNSLPENKENDPIAQVNEEIREENLQKGSPLAKDEERASPKSRKNDNESANRYDLNAELKLPTQKQKSSTIEAGLYASNVLSGSTKMYNGYGNLAGRENPSYRDDEYPILGEGPIEDPYREILVENEYREVYTDVKHKQPVTMGATVNCRLDDKWSLTSGITYTVLYSELRSGSKNYYYTSEQVLQYLGIPLTVDYKVWDNNKTSVYLSGGGLVEKNVSGELTTNYIVDNKFVSGQKDKISIDQLQWSANASIGILYRITSKIGLYAEPGISYYFKNGSPIETIYKDKPLTLSLRFGLRFSLSE